MRYRITVRGEGIELRGYIDATHDELAEFAQTLEPLGIVVASSAADDYNPFETADD